MYERNSIAKRQNVLREKENSIESFLFQTNNYIRPKKKRNE
jgi:hypothetical protein